MSGKVALITGATGGLGKALANVLIDDGYQLILTSCDAAQLNAVYGNKHLQIQADCANVEGAKHIFAEINAHNVIPKVLAHCVGNIRMVHCNA